MHFFTNSNSGESIEFSSEPVTLPSYDQSLGDEATHIRVAPNSFDEQNVGDSNKVDRQGIVNDCYLEPS